MIPCRSALRRLERRADDELELGAALELEAHLATCGRCAARARALARLEELLGARPEPALERRDLERSLERVLERIGADGLEVREARGGSAPRWKKLAAWLAAAAVLFALGLALQRTGGGRSAPEVPADDASALRGPMQETRVAEAEPPQGTEREHAATSSPREDREPSPPPATPTLVLGRAAEPDPARLLAVQAFLRRGLVAAGDPALVGAPPAWRDELDRRLTPITAPLIAQGWPVERMAAGWLASPDAALAGAAARLVGPRADALTLRRLEQAFESGADPLAAARALAENGSDGRRRLARRVLHPERGALARAALSALEPSLAAAALADGLRASTGAREAAALAALAADLARLGSHGARALLELGDEGLLGEGLALEALARTEGAPAAVLAALEGRSFRAFVPLAAARIAGSRALARLVERSARQPEEIAPALAWIDDPEALEQLARLAARGDLSAERFAHLATGAAARHPRSTERAARDLADAGDPLPAARLLEALAAEPSAAALPALAALLGARRLPGEVALAAVLALGESGLEGAAPVLESLLAGATRAERHVAAACMSGLARLRGEAAVERWLRAASTRPSPATVAGVLDALRRQGQAHDPASSLLRLARALEPALLPDNPYRRSEP